MINRRSALKLMGITLLISIVPTIVFSNIYNKDKRKLRDVILVTTLGEIKLPSMSWLRKGDNFRLSPLAPYSTYIAAADPTLHEGTWRIESSPRSMAWCTKE